jgi:hypothetical protein
VQRVSERAANTAKSLADAANGGEKSAKKGGKSKGAAATVAGLVDPLQLWGSLTQQFQHIAANALKEASTKTAADVTKNVATGIAKEAIKTATGTGAKKAAPRSSAAKRPARKKPSSR